MKTIFLTPSVSRELGGIYEIERNLAQSLAAKASVDIEVVGLRDDHTAQDLPSWEPLTPHIVPTVGPDVFGYAPELNGVLQDLDGDLLHLHVLWMYTSVASLQWSRRTGKPHIVTINGMLDPWAVRNSRWKKRIAGWLYENRNLRSAACLQVNTKMEYEAVREYGIETPVCIIPNGVTLPEGSFPDHPPWSDSIPADRNVLLFLGRIHPKKGLDRLLRGWKQVKEATPDGSPWALAVVGWDDGGHLPSLKRYVEKKNLSDSVFFLGPMFGDDKEAAYHHADAFILPSHSEGLPMAVLEAWSHRLPVLMTHGCNLPNAFEVNAALSISTDPSKIRDGLKRLFEMGGTERRSVGRRGRNLVEQRYTWSHVANQLRRVYKWILEGSPRPNCVVIE